MVCLLFALCGIHLYWSNTTFGVTRYTIADDTLPPALQGFTIVQISDLHNTAFGEQQSQLLEATAQQQPDIIAITGDFIDSYHVGAIAHIECIIFRIFIRTHDILLIINRRSRYAIIIIRRKFKFNGLGCPDIEP